MRPNITYSQPNVMTHPRWKKQLCLFWTRTMGWQSWIWRDKNLCHWETKSRGEIVLSGFV